MRSAGFALAVGSALVSTALAACGSSSNGSSPGGGDGGSDAAAPETGGEGSASGTYPAFTVDAPQIKKNQGTVIANPVVVTVTWPGDSNASTWEAMGDTIGASSFWSATTAEYGVSAATSGAANHVRMTQPLPASMSYYDVQKYVIATLTPVVSDAGAPPADAGAGDGGAPNPAWPKPTTDASGRSQTIYALYIGSIVTDPGSGLDFCKEGGLGYHDDVVVGGIDVPYSVTLECPSTSLSTQEIEETAVHELVEAATNPYPASTKTVGYVGFDADHLAWDLYTGFNDELADACQNWQDSYYQESGSFPYWAQRSWSNKAATAGHDPCVPSPGGAYHGMTLFPANETSVQVDLSSIGMAKTTTKGFKAALSQPVTFQVGFFSDAATGPWTIGSDFPATTQLFTTTGGTLGNGKGTVSIDKTSGQNGDQANVTVTITAKGDAGFHVMAITWDPPSAKGFAPHYLPVVIVDQ